MQLYQRFLRKGILNGVEHPFSIPVGGILMFRGLKKISIKEYDIDSVIVDSKKRNSLREKNSSLFNTTLSFSGKSLAIAISRTSFSQNPVPYLMFKGLTNSNIERYSYVISNQEIFSLNENIDYFMDFLKSANTGQLGQGINYLLADRVLNYSYIVNFESFIANYCNNTYPTFHGPYRNFNKFSLGDILDKKSPDFIIQKGIHRNVSILESKSTTSDSVRSELKKGLKQCLAGEEKLFRKGFKIDNSYVSTVKLKKENENKSSQIYLVDPAYDGRNKELSFEIIRFHYASWFAMIGDRVNAKRLLENKPIVDTIEPVEEFIKDNQVFLIFDFSIRFKFSFRVGIHSRIFQMLKQTDGDFQNEFWKYKFKELSDEKIEIFNDGTLILDDIGDLNKIKDLSEIKI